MRVSHLIWSSAFGGIEFHLIQMLRGMQAQGIDIALAVLGPTQIAAESVAKAATNAEIPVTTWNVPHRPSPKFVVDLASHIRTTQTTLVHTHHPAAHQYGIPAARRAGIPHLVKTCYDASTVKEGVVFRLLTGQFAKPDSHVIAVSEYTRRVAIAQGAAPARITLIPYGIAPDHFRAGKGAKMVLTAELGIPQAVKLIGVMCPLEAAGGVEDALKAFWMISGHQKEVHLLYVGQGTRQETLGRQANSYRIGDRVHFLGEREDRHAILSALDVLMVPCLRDDPTMLLLEAMALGTPIITTTAGGAAEILTDGQSGLLVAPGDINNLTSGLSLLLGDPDFGRTMAGNARSLLGDRFPFDQMITNTLALYESLISSGL